MSALSSKSSYSANIGEDYIIPEHLNRNNLLNDQLDKDDGEPQFVQQDALEINRDWRETIEVLRENEQKIYQPFTQRVMTGVKRLILEYGTNRLIFYSLYDKENIVKSKKRLGDISMVVLLQALFISQAETIVIALFFLNFAHSANLINLVLPFSAFFYALLENPMPSYRYWRFVSVYVLFAIAAKLIIQLPVFCSSPAFGIFDCKEEVQTELILVTRIDFIIGLTKFSGPASYP